MRSCAIVSLILACVALCSAQKLPPGVLQEVDLDGVIGFPNEFQVTAMAVDPTGDVYFAGTLASVPQETTAILTAGALAEDNILVVKMDAGLERVLYKTVIGGSGREVLYAMTVDESGAVYLSGITESEDFPETFDLAQPLFTSGQQAFVVKVNSQGDQIVFSTILGGGVRARALSVDASGAVLVGGEAPGTAFETTPGVAHAFPAPHGAGAFVARLDPAGDRVLAAGAYDLPVVQFLSVRPNNDILFVAAGTLTILNSPMSRERAVVPIEVADSVTFDEAGDVYLAGMLPIGERLRVQKFSPDGNKLLFDNTFDGSWNRILRTPLVAGNEGRLHMFHTQSANIPTLNTVQTCTGNLPPPSGYLGFQPQSIPKEGAHAVFGPEGATLYRTFTPEVLDARLSPVDGSIVAIERRILYDAETGEQPNYRWVRIDPDFVAEDHQVIGCVGHGATYDALPLSPGALMVAFGSRLGPADGVLFEPVDGRVPFDVAGTTVTVDDAPAPVVYAQDEQVNFLTPWSARTDGEPARVCVQYGGDESCGMAGTAPVAPGVVQYLDQSLVWNENGTINSRQNPAQVGSVVTFYVIGTGKPDRALEDGAFTGPSLVPLTADVSVSFLRLIPCSACGVIEVPAEVLEVGSAPHHVLGITSVTVRIPEGANDGDFTVTLAVPGEPDGGYSARGHLWLPPGV